MVFILFLLVIFNNFGFLDKFMYNKFLIVASKNDKAGANITTALSQFRKNPILTTLDKNIVGFDFHLIDGSILREENLDLNKINNYDFVIFASQHKSEKNEKTLSIHAPGNFKEAKFGGKNGKICRTSALFQKYLFETLYNKARESKLDEKYKITLEATHHGPLINKPCLFIEIGSTETEWNDRRAAFVLAQTIKEAIENFKKNEYREVAVGIGGPHYCPNFNKLQLKSNIAISHVIPSYILPLDKEIVLEAIRKTEEEVDFVVVDWKGIGDETSKSQITKVLEENYIAWKKLSSIKN